MNTDTSTKTVDRAPLIPIEGQSFASKAEWVRRGRNLLTAHPDYFNAEHDGPEKGWRGHHFTVLCFDQQGRRVRIGGDFQRAEAEDAFPVYWLWPDQIDPTIRALAAERDALRAELDEARGMLRSGADLLSIESEALKSGISIGDKVSDDPEDAHTIAAINELEGWIGDAAAFLAKEGRTDG